MRPFTRRLARTQGCQLLGQLEEILRLIYRESGHEHFNGCIVFPIFNGEGHVVEMYGRRLTHPIRSATKHLYLPGPHAGVWNDDGIREAREWIVCESIIDALSLWVHGFENVTASYGVGGFTPDHWKRLRETKPERVLIAYDKDAAGNAAANELTQQLEGEGVKAWRVELPPNSDINDVARESEDPKAALSSLLAASIRLLPEQEPRKPVAVVLDPPKEPVAPKDEPKGKVNVSDDGSQAEMTRIDRSYLVAVSRKLGRSVERDRLMTQAELDYELANRFIVLSADEDRERTRRIHEAQRENETLTGLLRKIDRDDVLTVHHNAQKLLRSLWVINPYARYLTFPEDQLRLRRDHQKYLGLIRTVAFLRQYQKPTKSCEH